MLYAAFGEDKSSFGLLRYKESKERKSVLQPLFSKRGILGLQHIIRGNVGGPVPYIFADFLPLSILLEGRICSVWMLSPVEYQMELLYGPRGKQEKTIMKEEKTC